MERAPAGVEAYLHLTSFMPKIFQEKLGAGCQMIQSPPGRTSLNNIMRIMWKPTFTKLQLFLFSFPQKTFVRSDEKKEKKKKCTSTPELNTGPEMEKIN